MGRRLKNIHPGEVLGDEFLKPLEVTHIAWPKKSECPQRECRRSL